MWDCFLTKPSLRHKNSFLEAVFEVQNENESNPFSASMVENKLDVQKLSKDIDFQKYLDEVQAQSLATETASNGWVPNTTLWLVGIDELGKEVFIGRVNVRHYLTNRLRNSYGHLGYLIRPKFRKMGYGNILLKLILEKIKNIVTDLEANDNKILITCKAENIISQKIILKHGAVFEREVTLANGKRELLYWLQL